MADKQPKVFGLPVKVRDDLPPHTILFVDPVTRKVVGEIVNVLTPTETRP